MPHRAWSLFLALTAGACAATIEIDAARPLGHTVPRTIFGTFLEPIGNAIYGGLWAQAIENPSFEEGLWSADAIRRRLEAEPALARASRLGLPLPWEPLDGAQGNRYEPRWGDAANSSRSLLIMALPGKQTGVRQQVYLPTGRTAKYTGWLWAKHVSGLADIEVSLRRRDKPAEVLSRAPMAIQGTAWARYEFALELPAGAARPLEPLDFVIAARDGTRVLVDQAMLFPADHVQYMDPEMVQLARELRTPLVRFGGNFTSAYHWRDGTGPLDKRVSMLNLAWGMPEYNHFGTDEFLAFCRLVGARPQICLNLGSGTAEEAAAWVRYVNAHWGEAGLLWELGNELWGNFQVGYPTLDRVGGRTRAFAEAVRRADPRAGLIATGQDPDHFREWNARQLAEASGVFDYLSTHFVVGTGRVQRKDATPDFLARAAFALPVQLERQLREMEGQIRETPWARDRVRIAFTEWLFDGPNDSVPRFHNMGGAICAAGFLNMLMRAADAVPISDMTGLIEFGGIYKKRGRVYAVPAYWAFRMYSTTDATQPVAVHADVETYDVREGNTRLPEIPGVPYLDVVAALDATGAHLTLFCVNRNHQAAVPARVRLAGFRPAPAAAVETLSAQDIHTANDEEHPDNVRPRCSEARVAPEFDYTFPAASVTVLRLVKQ
jgi:alpha-N-arabinofuranosidase